MLTLVTSSCSFTINQSELCMSQSHTLQFPSPLLPFKRPLWDFQGGTVDRNLPANAGEMGLIPGPGRFHMPWSN